jgi:hypothetical protein
MHFGINFIMTNIMHTFLIYLSIYFCLTHFGLSFSPSSEAGVQIWQWFKSAGYGVSDQAMPGADTIPKRLESLQKLYMCLWRWAERKPETCKAEVNRYIKNLCITLVIIQCHKIIVFLLSMLKMKSCLKLKKKAKPLTFCCVLWFFATYVLQHGVPFTLLVTQMLVQVFVICIASQRLRHLM